MTLCSATIRPSSSKKLVRGKFVVRGKFGMYSPANHKDPSGATVEAL